MHSRRLLDALDLPTIVVVLVLVGLGVFSIASATIEDADRAGLWKVQLV